MKKIYTLIAVLFFATGAFAQSQSFQLGNRPLHVPHNPIVKHPDLSRTTNSFYMDYDTADAFNWSGSYSRFIWDHNMHYTPGDTTPTGGGTPLKYCIVAFDSLFDPYNLIPYSNASTLSISVDSIFAFVGQENNSGMDDTLIVKIVTLTAAGYPTNSVLWADTTIIPASTPLSSPDWLDNVQLSWAPAFAANVSRFGVRFEYFGDKLDTFGIVAGFGTFTGPCGTNPSATLAQKSNFTPSSPNSFNFWAEYNQVYPTASGYIYYDCNGNSAFDAGTDGASYLQNLTISTYVTISDQLVGVHEQESNGIKLSNSPNPFSDKTTIRYQLQKAGNVEIEFTDITGRVISTLNEGFRSAGKYSATFDGSLISKGIYFYTLKTENGSNTNRMILTR